MPHIRFSKEHAWILSNGETATIGITAFAASQLGDILYVELPEPGTELKATERAGSIESVKTVSDIFVPAGGTVTEINPALSDTAPDDEEHFEYINQDPLGKGWLFRIRMDNPKELEALLTEEEYTKIIKESE